VLRGTSASLTATDLELEEFVTSDSAAVFVRDQLEEAMAQREASCTSLASYVAWLRSLSTISQSEARQIPTELGRDTVAESRSFPDVVLSGASALALARARLLPRVAQKHRVSVTGVFHDQCQRAMNAFRRRSRTVESLESLIERLRLGIESGTFVMVETSSQTDVQKPDVAALQDLIYCRLSASDAVWIDDRASSRLQLAAPVVGVADILSDLRRRTLIDEATYLEKHAFLRAMSVRFLPLNVEELLLRVASGEPEVFDTRELLILTYELASSALDPALARSPDTSLDEFAGVTRDSRTIASVLPQVWLTSRSTGRDPTQVASAIVERLYVSLIGIAGLMSPDAPESLLVELAARELVGFFYHAVAIAVSAPKTALQPHSDAAKFVQWVSRTFALRRFRSDPAVLDGAARQLRTMIDPIRHRVSADATDLRALMDACISFVFTLLPDELQRAAFERDGEFWRSLGVELTDVIGIGNRNIPDVIFWNAVREGVPCTYEGLPAIAIRVDEQELFVQDPIVVHLSHGSPDEWRAWANARSDLFDSPVAQRRKMAEAISAETDLRERLRSASSHRSRSASEAYKALENQFRHAITLDETSFILPIESLADHLRFAVDQRKVMSPDTWAVAAAEIWEDLPATEALSRIISVPLPIPEALHARIAESPEIESLMLSAFASARAPVPRMHLTALAIRLMNAHPSLAAPAREVTGLLVSSSYREGEFATFEAILLATSAALSHDRSGIDYAPTIRYAIAWSHAARIQQIMSNENAQKVRAFFEAIALPPRDSLSREARLHTHILAPHYVAPFRTVLHGLGVLMLDVSRDAIEQAGVADVIRQELQRPESGSETLTLLLDPDLFTDSAGTIFHGDRSVVLAHLLGEELAMFSTASIRVRLLELMATAKEDAAGEWSLHFGLFVSQLSLYADLREPFRKLARMVTSNDVSRAGDRAVFLLRVLADQVGVWGEVEDRQYVEVLFFDHLRERSDKGLKVIDPLLAESYLSIAFALSAEQDPAKSARRLAIMIEQAIDTWPLLGYTLATRISSFVWWLPLDQGCPLWRAILRARERSSDPTRL
jgi:hypothetical protein